MFATRPFIFHTAHTLKLSSSLSIRSESTHVFKEVIPWKNTHALAKHLAKNILYNKGGVVAVNKPFGIGSSAQGTKKQYLNAAPVADNVFNLYDALPYLANEIGCEELFVASVPERYTSGVTVLTTSSNLQKKVKNSIQISKVSNDTMNQYYAVVVGSPRSLHGSFRLGITMSSKVPNQPILVPVTTTGLKKQNMHSVRVMYETLSSSNLASLLAIKSSTAKLFALRIICTDKFVSPILGDNMFGSRVKTIMGRVVLVGFNEESIKKPMKLTTEMLEALELQAGEELIIPTHLHLHEVQLTNLYKDDILLRAPLPSVFQWSCKKLELKVPECKPSEKIRKRVVNEEREEVQQEKAQQIQMGVSIQ